MPPQASNVGAGLRTSWAGATFAGAVCAKAIVADAKAQDATKDTTSVVPFFMGKLLREILVLI
jgi:hypothetical protein